MMDVNSAALFINCELVSDVINLMYNFYFILYMLSITSIPVMKGIFPIKSKHYIKHFRFVTHIATIQIY